VGTALVYSKYRVGQCNGRVKELIDISLYLYKNDFAILNGNGVSAKYILYCILTIAIAYCLLVIIGRLN